MSDSRKHVDLLSAIDIAGNMINLPYSPMSRFVKEVDPLDPKTIYIRTSERLLFRRCRRLWAWTSPLKLYREIITKPDYFWFGTGMHYALEDYHGINYYGHPAAAFIAYCRATQEAKLAPGDLRDLERLGVGMMVYYKDHWLDKAGRDPLQTYMVDNKPQCEVRFQIPLPITGPNGEKVIYRGQIDRMSIDEYGLVWVVEYKSAKSFRTQHFDTDDQCTAYCVPMPTEILTRQGWKKCEDLVIGQDVLGYNTNTNKLEWCTLENVHKFQNRETVNLSNKSFSFICTPDHRWVQINENNIWPKSEGIVQLKPVVAGQQHHKVILAATLDVVDINTNKLTPDEAAVLGWLFTDGTHTLGDRASIGQKKYVQEVQDLLSRIPESYTRKVVNSDGMHVWHLSTRFLNNLYKKAHIDFQLNGWEQFVLNMPSGVRKAFCDAAMLGDGTLSGNTFYQKPGKKQEMFRLAFFLNGQYPTEPRIGGKGNPWSEPATNTFTLSTAQKWVKTIKSEPAGKQDVWCPQTSLGTWVMRQGNQMAITGNCWAAQAVYGIPIAGVIYQQHKKAVPTRPKLLSTGKVSTSKTLSTTHALYASALIEHYGDIKIAPKECQAYLRALIDADEDDTKDKFIQRDIVQRNQYQIAAQGEKILLEVEDMLREDLPLYPNPNKDCSWQCPLEAVCLAIDDGSEWDSLFLSLTRKREEESDEWRIHLPQQVPEIPAELLQLVPQMELPEQSLEQQNKWRDLDQQLESEFLDLLGPGL